MMTLLAAALAIVTLDQAPLRASPRDSAQQQVVLWQGDSLEVRGEKADYLQVYDHRRERAGYVKASQVRQVSIEPDAAPESLAVVRFLRDTPGAEALGISYVATYLKAAPAEAIGAEVFDAMGVMAERLAKRASSRKAKQDDTVIAAHLEVVAYYGINIQSFERDGRVQLCYEGEAFRRVLGMDATSVQKARAALAVTRQDCLDPAMTVSQRVSIDAWRAEVMDKVALTDDLPEYLKNRVRMRRAGIWAAIAHQQARQDADKSQAAAKRALFELMGVNKMEFTDEDNWAYTDAAIRVGASRWAAETLPVNKANLSLVSRAGEPGETCVLLTDAKHSAENPLAKRCTYSQVWLASARVNSSASALALAVQPMAGWRELWLFHRTENGWLIDVLPPAASDPELGYVEFAGWVPATDKFLVAREIKVDSRFKRSFDLVNIASLQTEKSADKPENLTAFYRWQDPQWKQQNLIIR
ncbi:hypothetical protein GCM10011613_34350 [Cellvibrio zantedeschiae]|uniref:SH3b domain-containing protein n=1 Tax=Cellvibrio zantedeschiae TaxID=1237077 RepID=A0ABQ3BEG3_9GAMM|nr:hypothetical protein [Cellvibrio zantedeschiae]GGY86368.1 hypothetical protein GCM10011613_34350 [Cellvibrio zantedeschiae]